MQIVAAVFVAVFVNNLLTPGAVRPLTVDQVCAIKWGQDARHVDLELRTKVFEAYGIPLADRHLFVVDHLIPRELAGDDVFENLWPERDAPSRLKDRQENALHRAVCAPLPIITLQAAQQQMRRWVLE